MQLPNSVLRQTGFVGRRVAPLLGFLWRPQLNLSTLGRRVALLEFLRWQVNCDVQATQHAYTVAAATPPWTCECDPCRNFRSLGMEAFPEDFQKFCAAAGVDLHHPSEVYHSGRIAPGSHSYGGWFHIVGELAAGRDGLLAVSPTGWLGDFEQLTPDFAVGLTARTVLVPYGFPSVGVVQLEFSTQLPWILSSPERD